MPTISKWLEVVSYRTRVSVRAYFIGAIIAILIPALLTTSWLAGLSSAAVQEHIEHNIMDEASKIATFVEDEIRDAHNCCSAVLISDPTCKRSRQ